MFCFPVPQFGNNLDRLFQGHNVQQVNKNFSHLGSDEDRNRFLPSAKQGEAHLSISYLGRPSAMGTGRSEAMR